MCYSLVTLEHVLCMFSLDLALGHSNVLITLLVLFEGLQLPLKVIVREAFFLFSQAMKAE